MFNVLISKLKKSIFNSVFRWVKLLATFSFKSIIKNSFGFFSDIMVIITNTSIQFDFPGMNPRKYLFKGNPLLNQVITGSQPHSFMFLKS